MMHWIAAGQISGKPLTVTEWNVSPFPTPDRHTTPLYMAAMAAYQGWDAMMLYAYAQDPDYPLGSATFVLVCTLYVHL